MRLAFPALLLALAACRSTGTQGDGTRRIETRIEYDGANAFRKAELDAAIALDLQQIERRSTPKSAIDDAAYSLLEFYRGAGYVDCSVEFEIEDSDPDEVHALFKIVEGPRCVVRSLRIEGSSRGDDPDLFEEIGFGDVAGGARNRYFVAREVEQARDALESYYVARGFLDVRVAEPRIELDAEHRNARVSLSVEEGVLYRIASRPELVGGVPEIDAALNLGAYVSRPLAPRLRLDIASEVEEAYQRRGYPDVRVEARAVEPGSGGQVELVFDVSSGPRVTIADVRVSGNEKTRTKHILAHVALESGDLYDVRKVRDSFGALYRTGLFRRVRIELERGGAERRGLEIEVEEVASTELFVEPGYGSYERLRVVVGARENNWLGTGRSLQIEGLLAQKAQRVVAGISDPRLWGSAFEGSLSLFGEARQEPSFDTDERGVVTRVSRDIGPRVRASTEYSFRRSETSNIDVNDPSVPPGQDDLDLSTIALTGAFDDRDSPFLPTRGNLLRLGCEFADQAIGSQLDFTRVNLWQASFLPVRDGTVLGASWRAGVIVPHGGTDSIPIQERFFNGGESTVRSFKEDQLGPRDANGNPIGGEAFNVFSVELRQRLRGALEGAVFGDAGNVVLDAADFVKFDDMRYALGAGLRYVLPIGPLRIDAGWNPDVRPDEDEWVVHFSVGNSF